MTNPIFETTTTIKKPIDEVFEFFSKAENLEILTPEWLNFKIKSKLPIDMQQGTKIDYVIRLLGIPMKWKTDITMWQPPDKFQDTQIKGPYKVWIHTHSFEDHDDYIIMTDHVEYRSKGWILAPFIEKLFVRPRIEKIFAYRKKKMDLLFN